MNAFVFQHKVSGKFFGVRGWNTEQCDSPDDAAVVVFRPNYHGTGRSGDYQTGWHSELAKKLRHMYRRVEVNR